MYVLSGFIRIASMVSNEPSVNSALGELSQRSATFSRELGHYSNNSFPDVKLTSFNSKRNDALVKVDPSYVTVALQISQWLFLRSIDGSLSDDKENCRQQLLAQFGEQIEILSISQMENSGNYWLPELLIFKSVGAGEDNVIRLWYSDKAFQTQYDLYEILVVPIVDRLDDLHGNRENVLALLNSITVPSVFAKVDQVTGEFPPTETVSTDYDWVDKNDPSITRATPWTVVVYGEAGNNADLIRDALVTWILANSNFPREEWEKIYPDLFLPNEFFITPTWDRYSIPNQLTIGGIYSPTLKYADMYPYAISTFFEIPEDHIRQYMSHSTSVYKSLGFVSVGNPRNRNGIYAFDDLWPEYASITTSSHDFNRMSPDTSEFIMLLVNLFMTAENLTSFSSLPSGVSRVTRGGLQYLAMTYKKVLYLVSLKSNEIIDLEDPEMPGDPGSPFVADRLQIGVDGYPVQHNFVVRKGAYRGYQLADSLDSEITGFGWSTPYGHTHTLPKVGATDLVVVSGQYDDVLNQYRQVLRNVIAGINVTDAIIDYAVSGNRIVIGTTIGSTLRLDVLETTNQGAVALLHTHFEESTNVGVGGVKSIAMHPDGTWFAVAAIDGVNIAIYRITTTGIVRASLAALTTLDLNAQTLSVLKFSLDGEFLFAGIRYEPNDSEAYTQLRRYAILGMSISSPTDITIDVGPARVTALAVDLTGKHVAVACNDVVDSLHLYRINTDGSFVTLATPVTLQATDVLTHTGQFNFSKNGRFGYLTNGYRTVRVYEIGTSLLLAQSFDAGALSNGGDAFTYLSWKV